VVLCRTVQSNALAHTLLYVLDCVFINFWQYGFLPETCPITLHTAMTVYVE